MSGYFITAAEVKLEHPLLQLWLLLEMADGPLGQDEETFIRSFLFMSPNPFHLTTAVFFPHGINNRSENWLKSGTCGKDHDFPLEWLHLAVSFIQRFSIRHSKQYSSSFLSINIISITCLLRTSFTLLLSDVSAILPSQIGEHVFHLTANSSALCCCSQLWVLLLETPALKQWLLN